MNRINVVAALLLSGVLVGVASCGVLPEAGPSASSLQGSDAVSVVEVTPQQAQAMAEEMAASREATVGQSLEALTHAPDAAVVRMSPGDEIQLTLFSIPPCLPGAAPGVGCSIVPASVDIGRFTISTQGSVVLPYVGSVSLQGLDLESAQQLIASRFATTGLFQSPAAKIDLAASPRNGIIVTGSLGEPKRIAWNPGGVMLVDAITQSLGNGVDLLGNEGGETSRSAVNVSVFRGNAAAVTIPMQAALEHQIALCPGDRVVVTRRPSVRVVVLGGGVAHDGTFQYPTNPTLATVLAQASGLDTNVANNRAVFVLEPRGHDQKPLLYDFAWNQPAGLIASQEFPIKDGDLVYVDEALIVPIQKVVDTLFGAAAVGNLVK